MEFLLYIGVILLHLCTFTHANALTNRTLGDDSNANQMSDLAHEGEAPPEEDKGSFLDVNIKKVVFRECFPPNAYVRNDKGTKVLLKDLRLGEKVLSMDSNGQPMYTPVTMMLHKNVNQTTSNYVTIATKDGSRLTLTSRHLIPLSGKDFVFARNVRPGEKVTVFDPSQKIFKDEEVTSVELVTKVGLFAPLSMEGTLVVNDVFVSCYSSFPSHAISHFALSLWRILYSNFASLLSHETDARGIHWYPGMLMSGASYFNLL